MSSHKKALTLREQLTFAKASLAMHERVVETFDREMDRLDAEEKALCKRRDKLLQAHYEATDGGLLARAKSKVDELERTIARVEARGFGKITRGRAGRLLSRREKLMAQLKALNAQIDGELSDDDEGGAE